MKNWYLAFCKFATLALMVGLTMKFLTLNGSQSLVQANTDDQITICHATSSYSNPYTKNTVDSDSIINLPNGHNFHTGPVFYLTIPKHTDWGDIIPEFDYTCSQVEERWGAWEDGECNNGDLNNDTCQEQTVGNGSFALSDRPVDITCPDGYDYNQGQGVCKSGRSEVAPTITLGNCPADTIISPSDETKCQSTVEGTKTQRRNLEEVTVIGSCHYDGKNLTTEGLAILANNCIAPDACTETVSCDDSCRTEEVIIQGSCDPIVCPANAESCDNECPVAQSCPTECGLSASTVSDGECGLRECQATAACATPTPTPTPTPSPVPTEPPGYNCPVAQSCPSACGQGAQDVPNGSCGFNHCDPTPSCDGGIGGGNPTGTVLGTATKAASVSGQVLGATTYAATGVAEDIAFALIGMTGAGLSSVGILMKKNAKIQK